VDLVAMAQEDTQLVVVAQVAIAQVWAQPVVEAQQNQRFQ